MTDSPFESPSADSSGPRLSGEASILIPRVVAVSGQLTPPPSKSFSHRYLNLALLARKPLVLDHLLVAEDTRLFLAALETCGFAVEVEGDLTHLTPKSPKTSGGEIYCGNAGTMFRFLVASLCVLPGRWRIDGTPRLRQRTVAPLVDALRRLGAEIHCPEEEGFAPLEIRGGSLRAGPTHLDAGQSSQFLSALLLAGQKAPGEIAVEVEALTSAPYLQLTLDAIRAFQGSVTSPEEVPTSGSVEDVYRTSPSSLGVDRVRVEGDFSAACYPAAAAALLGGPVRLTGVEEGSHQGDRGFFDVLERMGATVNWGSGGVEIRGGSLRAVTEDFSSMPDQVPTLAALAPFARGTTRILNVAHLRIKESDRLHAMATELSRLGVPVVEGDDHLIIEGIWSEVAPKSPEETAVETYDDHRIAMSLALVGLRRGGVRVLDPRVVGKSYPGFWADLEVLIGS